MTAPHLERGAAAEALAADYLQRQGLALVGRNLRCKVGEIDLVCLDGEVLVIVEVRQRGSCAFGGALASVSWKKRRRLIRATEFHRQHQPGWRDRAIRFDVIALQGAAGATHELVWIKGAFRVT